MSARVVPAACVTVGILGSGLDEEGIARHPEFSTALLGALRALQSDRLPARHASTMDAEVAVTMAIAVQTSH